MTCKAKGNMAAKPCAIPKGVSTEVPRYGTVAALPVYSPNPHYHMYPLWPYGHIANNNNVVYELLFNSNIFSILMSL